MGEKWPKESGSNDRLTANAAAANPKFGSFDDQKDPQENIEFQSTILSRFDTIFIVLDER